MNESYIGFFVDWIEEWSQFFVGCNWRTFHPIFIEVEDDRSMGGVEATVIVLGVGFRVRWNYRETPEVIGLREQVSLIREHVEE